MVKEMNPQHCAKRAKLSKGILEMKFMQKTKVKLAQEQEDAEGRAMYSEEMSDRMLSNQQCNFVVEQSLVQCEGLVREGRYSFRGMNPEIERYAEQEMAQKRRQQEEQRNKQRAEVSNEDMARFFYGGVRTTSLSQNVAKKFRKRDSRHQNGSQEAEHDDGELDVELRSPAAKGKKFMRTYPEPPRKNLTEKFKTSPKFRKPRDDDDFDIDDHSLPLAKKPLIVT